MPTSHQQKESENLKKRNLCNGDGKGKVSEKKGSDYDPNHTSLSMKHDEVRLTA